MSRKQVLRTLALTIVTILGGVVVSRAFPVEAAVATAAQISGGAAALMSLGGGGIGLAILSRRR